VEELLLEQQGLLKKTVRGTFWLVLLRIFDQIFRFIKTIILARILSPDDFGLFGIAFIAISILDSFSQTGFQQALIRHKNKIEPYLDTAWMIQILRGFLLAILLFLSAPTISYFFGAPEAVEILRAISLAVLLQGFVNIGVVYFQRDIEMKKYFLFQAVGVVADFGVAVGLAIVFKNVWALVIGYIVANVIKTIFSYVVHSYRPRFKMDFPKAKELFSFGKWIFGSNVLSFFLLQADSIFVEKFLGIASLGFYQISYKISSIVQTDIISGALFPAFSKIQHDSKKLKNAYLKALKLSMFVFAPATAGIVVLANRFILLFLGVQWLPSVSAVKALAISGFLWSLASVSAPIFQAIGKPKLETKYNFIRLLIMIILLFPFIKFWGLLGASMAVLLSVAISVSLMVVDTIKILEGKMLDFLKISIFPILNSLLMFLVVYLAKLFIIGVSYLGVILLVFIGVISYLFFVFISDRFLNYKIFENIKESINALKNKA
jgi:O-antigen/teichoic acid export membrane protein